MISTGNEIAFAMVAPGVRIAYQDEGQGAPALVFLHGAFADHTYFAPQVQHLSSTRRVLALDLRGHGQSDAPAEGYGHSDLADDVIAVCEAAGIEQAVFCGHSGSAIVALLCATRRPDLASGVVMLDGTILFPDALRARALAALLPALETDGWAAAMQGWLVERTFGPYDSPLLKARVAQSIADGTRQFAAPFMRDIFSSDHVDTVTSTPCPLLYIHGSVPADVGRLRELRPDAIVGVVAGAGHYMSLEVPDQVNAMIDRFFDRVIG